MPEPEKRDPHAEELSDLPSPDSDATGEAVRGGVIGATNPPEPVRYLSQEPPDPVRARLQSPPDAI